MSILTFFKLHVSRYFLKQTCIYLIISNLLRFQNKWAFLWHKK